MYEPFVRWSSENLGQWHYVLGYVIVLTSHNWPIMLALSASLYFGFRAYIRPSRLNVNWLLTALLLGLVYEYAKHIAPELHAAIDFLFHIELSPLNRPLHLLVGPMTTTILLGSWVTLLAQSLRLSLNGVREHQLSGHRARNDTTTATPAPPARD